MIYNSKYINLQYFSSKKDQLIVETLSNFIKSYSKNPSNLKLQLEKLLISAQKYEDELKDEFFLQIFKNMINNKKEKRLINLFQLLAIISSTISPTPRIFFPSLNFLKENKKTKLLTQWSNFCFLRILGNYEGDVRKSVPSSIEIKCIEFHKKLHIPIHFFNGNHIFLPVESYTLVSEVTSIKFDKFYPF